MYTYRTEVLDSHASELSIEEFGRIGPDTGPHSYAPQNAMTDSDGAVCELPHRSEGIGEGTTDDGAGLKWLAIGCFQLP